MVVCFSAANMSTAIINTAVMNISMNTPWAEFIPCCRNVLERHESQPARFQTGSKTALDTERPGG